MLLILILINVQYFRMLFLALKKVQTVKITPPQVFYIGSAVKFAVSYNDK